MYNVVIVILNYLNYKDTLECVRSISEMQYDIKGIVIVDNGSDNGSFECLKRSFYQQNNVHVIKSLKNLGFARGNNLGIRYARKKLGADFVLVINNDIIFIDKDYLTKMIGEYRKGVGIIGSKIIVGDNNAQPQMVGYLGMRDCVCRYLNGISKRYGSCFDFPVNQGEAVTVLHGCALLFTKDFFEKYNGLYPGTFLYCEEYILYLMCQLKDLKQIYCPTAKLYHKEDQSSLLSFQNDDSVKQRYVMRSEKHVILWKILTLFKWLRK